MTVSGRAPSNTKLGGLPLPQFTLISTDNSMRGSYVCMYIYTLYIYVNVCVHMYTYTYIHTHSYTRKYTHIPHKEVRPHLAFWDSEIGVVPLHQIGALKKVIPKPAAFSFLKKGTKTFLPSPGT